MCPREVRDRIALKLEDWKMVGRFLKLPAEKLTAIEVDNKTEEYRRVALLDDWEKREGNGATYLKLAEALHHRGRSDLVKLLCDELKSIATSMESKELPIAKDIKKSPTAVSDTAERIEALESQFDSLHRQLMSEIIENETLSGMELLRALTMLPISLRKEYESLIQQMLPSLDMKGTVTELFLRLSPLFRFIDYELLGYLISKFGSLKLQEDMKLYVSKIQIFMRETTVADLMDYWPGDEQPHLNYSKLKAKFSSDPKSYTLERLNNFRRKFCSKVRLSEFIFSLVLLESGESFFITWLVPTVVTSELKMITRKIEDIFYREECVLMISLDQEVLYLSVEAVKDLEIQILKAELDRTSEELEKVKTELHEKDLEIQMLKTKLDETNKELRVVNTDLRIKHLELQMLKTKLDDETSLELQKVNTERQELTADQFVEAEERENIYNVTDKPMMLEILQRQHRLSKWLLEIPSIRVPPSDSGLATSIADINEGSETPGDFEQQFLQDLAMKQEELDRKEEEIARLKQELDRAESSEKGEAEKFELNIRELKEMLRIKAEEVAGLTYEVQHFHTQMESMQAAIPFNEKDFYRMDRNPHGICIIINNHKFYHPTDPSKARTNRGGAEVDQKNLRLTFQYLRYNVEIYENLTHTQMMDVMLSMAHRDHAEYDSFVCCILTHGEENLVYGADTIPVSLLDLTGVMKMCKTLINKPKMFFIQCARGDHEAVGHCLDVEEADQHFKHKLPIASTHTIPQEADFFFGYATPLGNAAYRSRRHGSWYISELCKMLTTLAYTSNLSNMMRRVNDNVCKAFTKDGHKQTAEFVDRLRKGVHFFHFSKVQQKQLQHTQPPAH